MASVIVFLLIQLKGAGIEEVLYTKVLKKGMNKTRHKKGLIHSGRE
jgi:hypothetical protein